MSEPQPQLFRLENKEDPKYNGIPKLVVSLENMYDVCLKVHHAVGDQRTGMESEAAKFYANVTRKMCVTFLKYSEEFQLKRSRRRNNGLVVKPIISECFNSRMQIDLVDMQSMPDGEFKWILNAQDHLTKFCHLRPLRAKSAKEVSWALFKIFCRFGAPVVLQSDNGKEFRNEVIRNLTQLWPGMKMVHGKARKPSTQGSVERANGDFQNLLGTWMRQTKSTKWTLGLPIVEHQKNRKFHSGIKSTPYNALFGHEAYNGLEIFTQFDDEQRANINTLNDLYRAMGE